MRECKFVVILLIMLITNIFITAGLSIAYMKSSEKSDSTGNFAVGYLNLSYNNLKPWKHYGLLGLYIGDINTEDDTAYLGAAVTLGHSYEKTIDVKNSGSLTCDVVIDFSSSIDPSLLNVLSIETSISSPGNSVQNIGKNKWLIKSVSPGENIYIKSKIFVLLSLGLGKTATANLYYDIYGYQNNIALNNNSISYAFLYNLKRIKNTIRIG